jgi:Domain of unknown function DUF29
MVEPARKPKSSLYDRDFSAWSEFQARSLKKRNASDLDWDNLAEEIETLGRSERSEIRSRLVVLLLHLLKWQYQPAKRKPGWKASVVEARDQIARQIEESPSLRAYPASVLDKSYEIARLRAADETDLEVDLFPEQCPYSMTEILDENFYPNE